MLLRVSPPTAAVTVAHANRGDRVPGRLDWLDGLRFCAIFGVMLSHVAYALPALGRDWVIGLASGRYGVDLFFAISGFLFAELMIGRRMEAWRYLCRRGLRIIAVYYLAAGLYLWLAPTRPSLSVLAANAAFLNTWFNPTIAEVVPGGWSICDEVFFYLSGVLLLPWLRTSQRTAACWAVVLATCMLLARFGPGLQFANAQSPLMNLPTFLGGVLGWHYRDAAPRPRVALAVTLGCLVVTVAAALQVLPFGQRYVFGCVAAVGAWAGGSVLRAWSLTPRLAAYGETQLLALRVSLCRARRRARARRGGVSDREFRAADGRRDVPGRPGRDVAGGVSRAPVR